MFGLKTGAKVNIFHKLNNKSVENVYLCTRFFFCMRCCSYSPMAMTYSLMNEAPGSKWLMRGLSLNSPL